MMTEVMRVPCVFILGLSLIRHEVGAAWRFGFWNGKRPDQHGLGAAMLLHCLKRSTACEFQSRKRFEVKLNNERRWGAVVQKRIVCRRWRVDMHFLQPGYIRAYRVGFGKRFHEFSKKTKTHASAFSASVSSTGASARPF